MAAGHLTRQSYAEARLERLRYLQSLHAKAARIRPGVAKYYDDPLGFLDNCIDWRDDSGPTDYQREIIGAFPVKKREAVRSPHGAGKSGTAAWVMLWFALTRDAAGVEWKGVATAGAWRQLINYLFPELHKWAARLRWDVVRDGHPFTKAELLNLNLRLRHGALSAAACTTPALIEGAHADSLLFIYDEAKAIPAGTFDACEGAFSGAGEGGTEAFALALSTPGPPQGRFYDICKHTARLRGLAPGPRHARGRHGRRAHHRGVGGPAGPAVGHRVGDLPEPRPGRVLCQRRGLGDPAGVGGGRGRPLARLG